MPGHILQANGRIFITACILWHSYAAHSAGIHDAFDARTLSSFEQVASALDVRLIEILWILRPEAVIGSHMKHEFAVLYCAGQRFRIAKIAGDTLHVEFPDLAGGPAQSPYMMATLHE